MATESLSHNPTLNRFEIAVDGTLAGYAEYELQDGTFLFCHTEILPTFEGQGLASKLARYALNHARSNGLRAVPVCSFFEGYMKKHPEYADLTDPDARQGA